MKISTIGTGMIVSRFLTAMKEVPGVECIACYSRKQESADKLAKTFNVKKTYTDLDEMLQDPEVDTVYIASPNSLHFSQAYKALLAGKNVIDEKPFTSNLEECDKLIETAKNKKLFIWEAITNQYLPNYQIIKDNLNKLGNIKLVLSNYSQYSSRYEKYINHDITNVFNPAFSGGALEDINIYNIYFVMGLFGKPDSYSYQPNLGYNGIDTSGVMIFEYPGFKAILTGAKDSSAPAQTYIQGDKATLGIDGPSPGVCKNVRLLSPKGDQIDSTATSDLGKKISIEQKLHMTYEISAFNEMYIKGDYEKCYKLLDRTRDVVEVMTNARKKAGIYFDADKKTQS